MKHRRGVAIADAFVLIIVGTLVAAYALTADERGDIEVRRAIYERFPMFPGAELIRDRSYEIRGDGRGTGDYGLELVYRLPADAKSAEVLGFIRSHIPSDWSEASDETCRLFTTSRRRSRYRQRPRPTFTPRSRRQPRPAIRVI